MGVVEPTVELYRDFATRFERGRGSISTMEQDQQVQTGDDYARGGP